MTYIVDRIIDDTAVCEDESGKFVEISATLLPTGVKEGDVLRPDGERYTVDRDATEARRRSVSGKISRIFDPHRQ